MGNLKNTRLIQLICIEFSPSQFIVVVAVFLFPGETS